MSYSYRSNAAWLEQADRWASLSWLWDKFVVRASQDAAHPLIPSPSWNVINVGKRELKTCRRASPRTRQVFPISHSSSAAVRGSSSSVPRPGFLDVRAAFTFIVRDGEAYLERSLLALLAAGSAFAEYRVFFLENDSVDGTRSILRRYIELYPRRIAGEMLSNVSWLRSDALCQNPGKDPLKRNCKQRLLLLARLRQRVLDLAWAWDSWDLLVSVDMDFVAFDQSRFLKMIAVGRLLHVTAIFGMSVHNGSQGRTLYYDLDAIWPPMAEQGTLGVAGWGGSGCLTPVRSAFGGFGVYYAEALRTAAPKYEGTAGWLGSHKTEHGPFNFQLDAAARNVNVQGGVGRGLLLVDPSFRPVYRWGGSWRH